MTHLTDPIPAHTRVAVFGLGLTGRAAVRLLRALGKHVVASDSRALDFATEDPAVDVRVNGLDLGGASAVVLSPGLNLEWPENRAKPELAPVYAGLADGSLAVYSEVDLAAASYNGKVLTVGGTDGKSTTAALAAHLLNARGVPTLLGGNSWRPLSDVLLDADLSVYQHAVVEVSAFQLWSPHGLRPDVALLTNIAADHLDHYASEADYVRAKRHVIAHMGADRPVIVYAADTELASWAEQRHRDGATTFGYSLDTAADIPLDGRATGRDGHATLSWGDTTTELDVDWHLPGDHNQKNLLGALLATWALTSRPWTSSAEVSACLATFRGLPHRVAFVRTLDDVDYYNDSKATNVHAALAGLTAFTRPLIAIVGGVDKGLDLAPLFAALSARARAVVAIGELQARLFAERPAELELHAADTFEAAIHTARSLAQAGDAVILSPACSSFDMFSSFEARGDTFETLVRGLR